MLNIKDGVASIIEATCPDKLCIQQKEISKTGKSIICLHNKLVIKVVGVTENNVDAIAD